MPPSRMPSRRKPRWGLIAIAALVAAALVAGLLYWQSRSSDLAASDYHDIGAGVSTTSEAPAKVQATVDDKIAKPPLQQVQQLGPVVHVTPDGPLAKPVTLRFKLNRTITDPRDVILAVNQTGKADDWQLVAPTKVDGQYAYYTTTHLSWWDPLWRSFTDLVNAVVTELKNDFNGLAGGDAEADKPTCNDEQAARDKGYSISWKGSEVLYWCLGLENGKPVVHIVNKRRYPIFVNHAGISVPNAPKSKLGVDWLAQQSFSNDRTVLMPFDQVQLDYDLSKGQSKRFTTEYNGFAESLNQLEFGVTALLNILTRFGAGAGTISNGAIKITDFDRVAEAMSKVMGLKDCANALNTDTPNVGAILSGCFSPADIADMFGWKGVLLATVMVVGPVVNFFRGQFDTLGDLLQSKDQESVTVSYNPPAAPTVLFVGTWTVHGAQMIIKPDGTGTYSWNAGPCPTPDNEFEMCTGHATISFKVSGASMAGTYTNVWYTTSDGSAPPSDFSGADSGLAVGGTFGISRNDAHTLITSDGTAPRPGNPYLCDQYAEMHNDSTYALCGA